MNDQWWSWALSLIGVTGFFLAGRKIWWAWYVNLANQVLWLAYSLITEQWGFLVATAVYTVVFTQNAYKWTKERPKECQHDWSLAFDRTPQFTYKEVRVCKKCPAQEDVNVSKRF